MTISRVKTWSDNESLTATDLNAEFNNIITAGIATTSAELRTIITDETGSGALVFATSPTLVTPTLGVATATSLTGDAIATQAQQETATSIINVVTPGTQQFHPSAVKMWGFVTVSGGSPTLVVSHNVTSIVDNALGLLQVNIGTDFSSANYTGICTVGADGQGVAVADLRYCSVSIGTAQIAGAITYSCWDGTAVTATAKDPNQWHFAAFGDLV